MTPTYLLVNLVWTIDTVIPDRCRGVDIRAKKIAGFVHHRLGHGRVVVGAQPLRHYIATWQQRSCSPALWWWFAAAWQGS